MNRIQYYAKRKKDFKKTFRNRFWNMVNKSKDCWIWTGAHSFHGYGLMSGHAKTRLAHRISYEFANGRIPVGKLILHKCDNPPCVKPAHLVIGTQSQNIQDAYNKGRKIPLCASKNGKSKITMDIAVKIRKRYAKGNSRYKDIAKEFNISDSLVGDIILNKSWH